MNSAALRAGAPVAGLRSVTVFRTLSLARFPMMLDSHRRRPHA
jgi:hypothetical protein